MIEISGDANANLLEGGLESEFIFGFQGDDTISTGGGNDTVRGGSGADLINLTEISDSDALMVTGDEDNDTIVGDGGVPVDRGGRLVYNYSDGSYQFYRFANSVEVIASGGDGDDSIRTSQFGEKTNISLSGDGGNDQITAVGGYLRNLFVGVRAVDSLYTYLSGMEGDDSLSAFGHGTSSVIVIEGGVGKDHLSASTNGSSSVTLFGDEGDDVIRASPDSSSFSGNLQMNGGDGADFIGLTTAVAQPGFYLYLDDATVSISGDGGHDNIIVTGGTPYQGIQGNNHFRVFGGDGNDTINTSFDDSSIVEIFGGPGEDSILINTTRNTEILNFNSISISGGAGDDLVEVSSDAEHGATVLGGSGNDTIFGSYFGDQILGNRDNDLIRGRRGADALFGGNGEDTLVGGKANDEILGGAARDTITGGRGSDTLDGGPGRDSISGGAGRDQIIGGRGLDTLTGGLKADQFVFGQGNGRNTITDFRHNQDKIAFEIGQSGFRDLTITQSGNDVRIQITNTVVIVEDDRVGNFTREDFIF